MSSLLVESPVNNSQLYFSWLEDLDCDQGAALPAVGPVCLPLPSAGEPPCDLHIDDRSNGEPVPERQVANKAIAAPTPARDHDDTTDRQEFTNDYLEFSSEANTPRISKPVRMGGVMIQLLKRYGITDEEINEGIARYALSSSRQAAS